MHVTTLDEVADDRYVPRNGYVSISFLPLGWLLVLLEEFLQKSLVFLYGTGFAGILIETALIGIPDTRVSFGFGDCVC